MLSFTGNFRKFISQNLSDIRSSSNVHRKFDYCPPYTSSCTRPDPASSRLAVGYIDADYNTSTSREQRYIESGYLEVGRCHRSTLIHTGPLRTSSRCPPPCNVWCSCLACLCLSCRGILETDVASCLSHTGHSIILKVREILRILWKVTLLNVKQKQDHHCKLNCRQRFGTCRKHCWWSGWAWRKGI